MKRIFLALVMMCGSAMAEQILYEALIEDTFPSELYANLAYTNNGIYVPYDSWDIWRATQTVAQVTYQDISPYFSTNEWSVYIPEGKQLKLISSITDPFIERYTMGMDDYYDYRGRIYDHTEVTAGIPQSIYNWLWDYDERRNTIYHYGLKTWVPFSPEGKFSAWYIRFEASTNLYPIIDDEYLQEGVDYLSEGLKFNRDAIIGPAYLINRNLVTPYQERKILKDVSPAGGSLESNEGYYIITGQDHIEHNMIFELSRTEQGIAQESLELLQAIASQTNSGQTTTITNTIVNTITNAVGYTLSEVADMRLGSQMVSVSNSQALLRFGLDMSDDLTATWQTNAYEIEVEIPATNDVQFFRLRMD